MRIPSLILLLLLATNIWAQIPETLISERSIVVLDFPLQSTDGYLTRGNWEKTALEIQKKLKLMGVDAIAYLHANDWEASPSSQEVFIAHFKKRLVNILMRFSKTENGLYNLSIQNFDSRQMYWETNGGSLNQTLLRLGRDIKQAGFNVENFLPADDPEIITDVPFSKWSASTSYPDQIKRLKIAVAQFKNEMANESLKEILQDYPFQFDLIEYTNDEDAFRKGYQYVLVNMNTSGESIKKLLNYSTGINETHYMSTVKVDSLKTRLKTIPVDALVHKFYFRHTVTHEAYVGREWDADVTWENALQNFILNLRIAFKKF